MKSLICLFFLPIFVIEANAQTFHNPEELFNPTPFAFNHSGEAPAKGSYIFIAGQSGADENYNYSKDFRTQVRYSLQHLKLVLDSYALKPENIVKITVLIVDHSPERLHIWSEEAHKFWDANKFPASTLIPVPRLASVGMLFEVDAIAYKKR